ncbi:MAG: hypothetical protein U9O20_04230 [Patescibacteria group bacterium]|nr:hypothetical protein [Patescibacteria group bacterium]
MQQNWQNEREGETETQNNTKASWLKFIDTRIVALFVLGILIGVTLKTHALKTVTMGFEDYKLAQSKHEFDLSSNKLDEEETAEVEEEVMEEEEEL